ncbi:MAG: ribokinase [Ramlibacter sp.]|nr:ribokinase [Cryobacterium sp.]
MPTASPPEINSNPAPRITVVGSFAVGLTLRAPRFPVPGETLLGSDFDQGPGGKGSNQAVAAARLGARVNFIGAVGEDEYAGVADRLFAAEGVGARLRRVKERNTSVGFIVLNTAGENFIILDPGANTALNAADIQASADLIGSSDLLVAVMEIPDEPVAEALRIARAAGVRTLLNPAPARPLSGEVLSNVDVLTPNESELRILLGLAPNDPTPTETLVWRLLERGLELVVVALGRQGALVATRDGLELIPSRRAAVVDTTGAGDAFNAALSVALPPGRGVAESARRAAAAGALAVTRLGVIPALPTLAELEAFLKEPV